MAKMSLFDFARVPPYKNTKKNSKFTGFFQNEKNIKVFTVKSKRDRKKAEIFVFSKHEKMDFYEKKVKANPA